MKNFIYLFIALVSPCLVYAYTQQDLLSAQYDYQVASDRLTQSKNNLTDASKNLVDAQQDRDKLYQKYQAAESTLALDKKAKESAEIDVKSKTNDFTKANDKVNQIWNSLNNSNN